jgi:hypothetical protein
MIPMPLINKAIQPSNSSTTRSDKATVFTTVSIDSNVCTSYCASIGCRFCSSRAICFRMLGTSLAWFACTYSTRKMSVPV